MRAQASAAAIPPAKPTAVKNDDMMAGSAIYRRIQAKPKNSTMGYVVAGVAVIALGAGALLYTQSTGPAAPPATVSAQQAGHAQQQATDAAVQADARQNRR